MGACRLFEDKTIPEGIPTLSFSSNEIKWESIVPFSPRADQSPEPGKPRKPLPPHDKVQVRNKSLESTRSKGRPQLGHLIFFIYPIYFNIKTSKK